MLIGIGIGGDIGEGVGRIERERAGGGVCFVLGEKREEGHAMRVFFEGVEGNVEWRLELIVGL